jgi:hypothetical protein
MHSTNTKSHSLDEFRVGQEFRRGTTFARQPAFGPEMTEVPADPPALEVGPGGEAYGTRSAYNGYEGYSGDT